MDPSVVPAQHAAASSAPAHLARISASILACSWRARSSSASICLSPSLASTAGAPAAGRPGSTGSALEPSGLPVGNARAYAAGWYTLQRRSAQSPGALHPRPRPPHVRLRSSLTGARGGGRLHVSDDDAAVLLLGADVLVVLGLRQYSMAVQLIGGTACEQYEQVGRCA